VDIGKITDSDQQKRPIICTTLHSHLSQSLPAPNFANSTLANWVATFQADGESAIFLAPAVNCASGPLELAFERANDPTFAALPFADCDDAGAARIDILRVGNFRRGRFICAPKLTAGFAAVRSPALSLRGHIRGFLEGYV